MAISQPIATDKLNNPDHSLAHRVIAIDSAAPVQSLTVDANGTTKAANGLIGNVTVVTDTYQILVTDETIVGNKATAFVITLPTAATGQRFTIINIGVGDITVEGSGTDTIDSELNQVINTDDSISVICYVANKWKII